MIICGIDPGIHGALAALDAGKAPPQCRTWDMPLVSTERGGKLRNDVDAYALGRLLREIKPDHVYVELVNAMPIRGKAGPDGKRGAPSADAPPQGVTSAFAFGRSFGTLIGVIGALELPMTFVSSMKWKRALGVPAVKNAARGRATQLLPKAGEQWKLVKHDGRAEAALIALFGLREYGFVEIAA